MTARHLRCTWQRLLLLLLVISGIGEIGYWAVFAEGIERPLDSLCASWDRDASAGVALLIPNATALGLLNLSLFGTFLALYALAEGGLWGACAWHTLWNDCNTLIAQLPK